MADPEAIAKAAIAVVAPLLTLIGLGGRRRRLRTEIRENLSLVEEIDKHDVLREHTLASGWLQARVALDVARLSGQKLGTPKAPIPKGSMAFAAVFAVVFGVWTYAIDRDGFVWYSVFPGTVAFLLMVSIFGMFTDRELPPEETGYLPTGATPAPTRTTGEQIATAVTLAATGGADNRSSPGQQVDVVYKFIATMQAGKFVDGVAFVDDNWLLCRVQSWLWNNRSHFGQDVHGLQVLADAMLADRDEHEVWADFTESEGGLFASTWGHLDVERYGAAGRRRRLSRDHDLVILAPVGPDGGYFVTSATALPDALMFVVSRAGEKWKVCNHLGHAAPIPGWPPIWWDSGDPTLDDLPG